MSEKLTIVVTCTARKAGSVDPRLQVRNLPKVSLPDRADIWARRVAEAVDKRPLDQLYKGEQWTASRSLARSACSRGFDVTLLVASAGLGIRKLTDVAPAYGATFTRGHADSVAIDVAGSRQWWDLLRAAADPDSSTRIVTSNKLLLVLSDVYADALDDDLSELARTGVDALLVGGSRDIEGLSRLRPRGELRKALGGTMTSLNLRMAARWLDLLDLDRSVADPQVGRAFDFWADQVAVPERYERAHLTDDDVVAFARELRRADPKISRTRALRRLRDSGWACEQRRFRRLFDLERAS